MLDVEVLVMAGAMPSSIAITFDVMATANRLRAAASRAPTFRVRVSGSGARLARAVAAGSGFAALEAQAAPGLVVVPGPGLTTEAAVAQRLAGREARAACRALGAAVERGAEVATSCSGAFLVAAAGLLEGRRATTSWWLAPLFRRLHPRVDLDTEALVVTDGPVTTAGAAMAQMDLMLSIVARHAGRRLADQCARYLLLDERRSQSRYMALGYLAAADPQVARAEAWARERLEEGFAIDAMAAAAGLAPRTFARRVERATGLSPVRFLQRLRVERAMELLETTSLPVEEVARRVGYAEPTTLRRLLRRDTGRAPRALRVS